MKSFLNYATATMILLGILSIYIPIHYNAVYPKNVGPQFNNHVRNTYIDLLNNKQPDIFMLGDSMPGQAVDEQTIADQTNLKATLVSLDGTASTIWYLIIKNNIVLAEHKPQYLVIFFRDSMMTVPGYRVTGRYFELIDEFASPADTLLIERAYTDQMGPFEKLMERYFPLYGSRSTIHESFDYYTRYPLGDMLLNCERDCIDRSMDFVFEQNNLDPTFFGEAIDNADSYLYSRESLNFDEKINISFLPEIIRLCKKNGIQLILVRMPIMRFYQPGTQPPGLARYMQHMNEYLHANEVPFLDFDKKELPSEYFKDTLHLNEKGRLVFTKELANALKEIVK